MPGNLHQLHKCNAIYVYKLLVITRLKIDVAACIEVVIDNGLHTIGLTYRRNGARLTICKQSRNFIFGGQPHVATQ